MKIVEINWSWKLRNALNLFMKWKNCLLSRNLYMISPQMVFHTSRIAYELESAALTEMKGFITSIAISSFVVVTWIIFLVEINAVNHCQKALLGELLNVPVIERRCSFVTDMNLTIGPKHLTCILEETEHEIHMHHDHHQVVFLPMETCMRKVEYNAIKPLHF